MAVVNLLNSKIICVLCHDFKGCSVKTHWGRVTHICVGKLTNIGSDNGLSPGRHQAIIWTNAGILLIGKTPVRIILWCPITKMLIKACFLIQPLEQEGVYQKCCISLCSKVFINHFYQMKASPECLNILTYWSKYWVDRLRRTLRRKV